MENEQLYNITDVGPEERLKCLRQGQSLVLNQNEVNLKTAKFAAKDLERYNVSIDHERNQIIITRKKE